MLTKTMTTLTAIVLAPLLRIRLFGLWLTIRAKFSMRLKERLLVWILPLLLTVVLTMWFRLLYKFL